jgi:hypothetical protein
VLWASKNYFIMKRFLIVCVALLAFTATAFAYRVGDVITVRGAKGVVFAVSSDGQHGKVVSVFEAGRDWKQAKAWCSKYGQGWRLPNKKEMMLIYKKIAILNQSLSAYGYSTLGYDRDYWALGESGSNDAWLVGGLSGGVAGEASDLDMCWDGFRVRAVTVF